MRFKKGDKVEIMNKKEAPVSWSVAEIRSGNAHSYLVEYDHYPGMTSDQMLERVSRKFVRPCPPPTVQVVDSCVAGDIVEVFIENSWNTAAILRVLGGKKENKSNKMRLQAAAAQNQYLVRLLGCLQETIVDKSNIRIRQSWLDDKWILMGKSSQGGEDVIASKPSTSNCYHKTIPRFKTRAKKQLQKDSVNFQDDATHRDSPMISSRSLKRMSPYCSSIIEVQNGQIQKLRVIEKDGRKQRVVAAPGLEKVDAVAYPREFLGEINMHASSNIISNGCNQMERAKLNVLRFSVSRSSELNTYDSDECSVGSCSGSGSQSRSNHYSLSIPLPCHETDTLSSDAESCSGSGSGSERKSSSLPLKEEVEISIHRLELHAYRSTLEALYASGPLSWDQEALLTNLRIMLHISNDEHLVELKCLISAKTAINGR